MRRRHGRLVAERMQRLFAARPEFAGEISERMKALWADPDYRLKMSEALRGIEKRPLTPEQKKRVGEIIAAKNRTVWGDPARRAAMTLAIRAALADPAVRARLSASAREQWRDPAFRARYGRERFSAMARALWARPEAVEFHREKIARQWDAAGFREAQAAGVRR